MITYKIATTANVEVLALLGRVTYIESHGHFIDDKKDLQKYCEHAFSIKKKIEDLKNKNNLFHIAYLDDFPVGYSKTVLNKPFENKTEKTSCRLERIYILNDFIPMKIGQPFLNHIINNVKKLNTTSIWLSVYVKNDRAIKFYQKNNFKNIGDLNFLVSGKEYENFVFLKKI